MPIEVGALPLSTQLFINNEFVDAKSGTKVRAATAPCEHLRRVDTCLPPLTTCRGAVLALATYVSVRRATDNSSAAQLAHCSYRSRNPRAWDALEPPFRNRYALGT